MAILSYLLLINQPYAHIHYNTILISTVFLLLCNTFTTLIWLAYHLFIIGYRGYFSPFALLYILTHILTSLY